MSKANLLVPHPFQPGREELIASYSGILHLLGMLYEIVVVGQFLVAATLGAGGVFALWFGYRLFDRPKGQSGVSGEISFGSFKATAKSVGAVVMITACFWGMLAYLAAPKFQGVQPNLPKTPSAPVMQSP